MTPSPQKIPVILATTFRGLAELLAPVLREEKIFEVVSRVREGAKVLETCATLPPVQGDERPRALVITDLELDDMPAGDLVRQLREHGAGTRVLIYSLSDNIEKTRAALDARPHGCAHLAEPLEEFRQALRALAQGRSYYSRFASRVREAPSDPAGKVALCDSELAVLKGVAEGKSSKQIGAELGLAPKTVDDYRGRVMNKLGIHNVAGLTHHAVKHKLLGT